MSLLDELRECKNNNFARQARIDLKESEIERLSYAQVDPLNIMIHLDLVGLFWY